mmetsp:Transcript_3068/g.10363  ORF Transcript_3068/g.10363 Transcript_3068/m.10363 type:complete len:372 (+) Transcript_3068:188-1303(+)
MMSSSYDTSGSSSRKRISSFRKSFTCTFSSSSFSGGSKVLRRSISSIISWISWLSRSISSSALRRSSSLVDTAFCRDWRSFCSASSCLIRCSRCFRSLSKSLRMCRRDLRSASSCFPRAAFSRPSAASCSWSCFTCFSLLRFLSMTSRVFFFSSPSLLTVSLWDFCSLSSSERSCSMELRRASSCVRRSCRDRANCDCSMACCLCASSSCMARRRRSFSCSAVCCSSLLRDTSLCCSKACKESMSPRDRENWLCSASRFCPSPSSCALRVSRILSSSSSWLCISCLDFSSASSSSCRLRRERSSSSSCVSTSMRSFFSASSRSSKSTSTPSLRKISESSGIFLQFFTQSSIHWWFTISKLCPSSLNSSAFA